MVRPPALYGPYAGDCVAGMANGRGRAKGVDSYEGDWRDGLPSGNGTYTFADGRRFEGEFAAGKANGRARLHYGNGDILEGSFKDGQLLGTGRLLRVSGEVLAVQLLGNQLVPAGGSPEASSNPQPPAQTPPIAPPGLSPMQPATPATPQAAANSYVCPDRLRVSVLSLSLLSQGRMQVVMSYESLVNVDLRLSTRGGSGTEATVAVDSNGERWILAGQSPYGWAELDKTFQPRVATRVTLTLQNPSGGNPASSFSLANPVRFAGRAESGTPQLRGTCTAQFRGLQAAAPS
jgi:hypothetical protein